MIRVIQILVGSIVLKTDSNELKIEGSSEDVITVRLNIDQDVNIDYFRIKLLNEILKYAPTMKNDIEELSLIYHRPIKNIIAVILILTERLTERRASININ